MLVQVSQRSIPPSMIDEANQYTFMASSGSAISDDGIHSTIAAEEAQRVSCQSPPHHSCTVPPAPPVRVCVWCLYSEGRRCVAVENGANVCL